jgi:hypothetical protein
VHDTTLPPRMVVHAPGRGELLDQQQAAAALTLRVVRDRVLGRSSSRPLRRLPL